MVTDEIVSAVGIKGDLVALNKHSDLSHTPLEANQGYSADKPVIVPPSLYESIAYIGSMDACLHSFDLQSGKLLWRYTIGSTVHHRPFVTDNEIFVTGERNLFIFKLASACCRFGLSDYDTERFINNSILTNDNTFSSIEAQHAIRSAYKSNANKAGSAYFEKDVLVDKVNRSEVQINPEIFNLDVKPKDVIFGEDVKESALRLYNIGYESAETTEVPELDVYWKWKKGEITLLSGIGNYGKSTFLKYILLIKSIKKNWKWALFAPEDFPAHEFYHDLVEMYIGDNCTPKNPNRVSVELYEEVYDWISKHFFFVYPKDILSTPEYIKERFLELIIKSPNIPNKNSTKNTLKTTEK